MSELNFIEEFKPCKNCNKGFVISEGRAKPCSCWTNYKNKIKLYGKYLDSNLLQKESTSSNAEELMNIMNKRLCFQASPETREVVSKMQTAVLTECPEFQGLLVPMCVYHGGKCHEMKPCKEMAAYRKVYSERMEKHPF